ncbi:MAG TPA: DUF6338 family protein [Actinomycetota bacterium]|nr:DUF6338 family protein [Actinomycetota bacterium]
MDTFEGLAVAAIAVLPGALYAWSYERQVGNWGIGLSDRLFRFLGTSALFHVLVAPVTYWIWTNHVRSGDLSAGRPLPAYVWLAVAAYAAIPIALGSRVGRATAAHEHWARRFTGSRPAPRAWDYFFASEPRGWVRLKLKSGTWMGGVFRFSSHALTSYAAGYPEAQDLFLSETADVDPATGRFILVDGEPRLRGTSLLIRWEEVEFLEFGDV